MRSIRIVFLAIALAMTGGVVFSNECNLESFEDCMEEPLPKSLVGKYLDEHDQKKLKNSPRTLQRMDRGDPLTVDDIIKLHQAKVADRTIIRYIQDSCSRYDLTATKIRRLQQAGISEQVINFMMCGEC